MAGEKISQTSAFAEELGIHDNYTPRDVQQLFLMGFAGRSWNHIYSHLHVFSADPQLASKMSSSRLVSRLASSSQDDELEESELKLAKKQLKQLHELLDSSSPLKEERNPEDFYSQFKQIAAFRKKFTSSPSPRLSKEAAAWSPLESAKRFFVAMHTFDFEILWEKLYKDSSYETMKLLKEFRKTNRDVNAEEFSLFLQKYFY